MLFGEHNSQQPLAAGGGEGPVLCSLAWMPDGSAVCAMDKWGNVALLDVHGAVHCLQPLTGLRETQQQVAHMYTQLAGSMPVGLACCGRCVLLLQATGCCVPLLHAAVAGCS